MGQPKKLDLKIAELKMSPVVMVYGDWLVISPLENSKCSGRVKEGFKEICSAPHSTEIYVGALKAKIVGFI